MSDNNYFAPGQFIVETMWEDFQSMHRTMIKSTTEETEYYDRTQYTLDINSVSTAYTDWILKKIQALDIPIESLEPSQSWYIRYQPYGYQTLHNHTNEPDLISTTMYFEDRDTTEELPEYLFDSNGCLYTVLSDNNETKIQCFPPSPGRTIIMNGNVNHGTYPYKHKRQCLVINFKAKWREPNELTS
jgi:hypothetical protein